VWIIAVVAVCAVLSVAGVLSLMWWHRKQAGRGRRRARPQRAPGGKAVPRAARVPPPQAIEHHDGQEFHIYGADGQEAAALIRKALNGGHQP
jgi:hypothetical protein